MSTWMKRLMQTSPKWELITQRYPWEGLPCEEQQMRTYITESDRREAQRRLDGGEQISNGYSVLDGKGCKPGVLGEIIFEKHLRRFWPGCTYRKTSKKLDGDTVTAYDYDITTKSGRSFRVEVKTKTYWNDILWYRDQSVHRYSHEHQKPTFYFFVHLIAKESEKYHLENFDVAHINGWIAHSDILKTSYRLLLKGEEFPGTKKIAEHDNYLFKTFLLNKNFYQIPEE